MSEILSDRFLSLSFNRQVCSCISHLLEYKKVSFSCGRFRRSCRKKRDLSFSKEETIKPVWQVMAMMVHQTRLVSIDLLRNLLFSGSARPLSLLASIAWIAAR